MLNYRETGKKTGEQRRILHDIAVLVGCQAFISASSLWMANLRVSRFSPSDACLGRCGIIFTGESPMLTRYIQKAMEQAHYELLPEDKLYYGEIPGFDGVWATGTTLEACRNELQEVLEEWILLRVARHLPLPFVGDIRLQLSEVS